MKFVNKVDNDFVLDSLFKEHLNKFNVKNGQELVFLEDVKNFVEKKSFLELQYATSLSSLCNQYLNKNEYQLTNESSTIYIPEKWKNILEQYSYVAEKREASARSMLAHCEYFKKIKEQKNKFNQIAINYLKKMQQTIKETHHMNENAYKSYCTEHFLFDQLNDSTKTTNSTLDKKLKKLNIDVSKFKANLEEILKSEENKKERLKKFDFSKLKYASTNCSQNQQLQYYFSMEIPNLLHLQNSQIDAFIDESLDSLALKELETSKFLTRQFDETFIKDIQTNSSIKNEGSSELFYTNNNKCFSNLIQYEFQPHDKSITDKFEFTFSKENIKHLSTDYQKWSDKLSELQELMKQMVMQINEKKIAKKNTIYHNFEIDFLIDEKLEEDGFNVDEKKMQMIHLESKIDALGLFNINLKDLEDFENANKFSQRAQRLDSDLHQNLELWDSLMRSIDNLYFSDDSSFDVDIERKGSSDFSKTSETSSLVITFETYMGKKKESQMCLSTNIDTSIQPRFAVSICEFKSNEKNYLSYEKNQTLIIYNKYLEDFFIAKNNSGQIGLVFEFNVEFLKEEIYVRSCSAYEGLDISELTFPNNAKIRVLSTKLTTKRNDGEEWWEGSYEDKIGYFPAIFVQEINNNENNTESFLEESLNVTMDQKVP